MAPCIGMVRANTMVTSTRNSFRLRWSGTSCHHLQCRRVVNCPHRHQLPFQSRRYDSPGAHNVEKRNGLKSRKLSPPSVNHNSQTLSMPSTLSRAQINSLPTIQEQDQDELRRQKNAEYQRTYRANKLSGPYREEFKRGQAEKAETSKAK